MPISQTAQASQSRPNGAPAIATGAGKLPLFMGAGGGFFSGAGSTGFGGELAAPSGAVLGFPSYTAAAIGARGPAGGLAPGQVDNSPAGIAARLSDSGFPLTGGSDSGGGRRGGNAAVANTQSTAPAQAFSGPPVDNVMSPIRKLTDFLKD